MLQRILRQPPVPADVETVLAWVVREATTNVVRHSGARRCVIRVRDQDGDVAVEVDDDGTAVAAGGGGTGLAGLAERARDLDGTFDAAARSGGGFRVRLSVPVRAT